MYTQPMRLDDILMNTIMTNSYSRISGSEDAIGVEIELEGVNLICDNTTPALRKFWNIHNDGSLRGNNIRGRPSTAMSCEYVFEYPMPRKAANAAIEGLFNYLNRPEVEVYKSYRTSIHVHLNCAQEKFRHIYNLITLCVIFDELLAELNGPHRIGNNFCLRFCDAEGTINQLCEVIQRGGGFRHISPNFRYNAINFASLNKFGSIEFRSMECHTDLVRMMTWLDVIQKLKNTAKEFSKPTEIIDLFSQYTPTEFLYRVLGPLSAPYYEVPDWKNMIHRGMRLAQDFAFCSAWIPLPSETEELKKKIKMAGAGLEPYTNWGAPAPENAQVPNYVLQTQFPAAQVQEDDDF